MTRFVAGGSWKKQVMGDAEIKDQAPAPGLISQVVPNLYITTPLAYACRHSVLCAHDVSSDAEQRPEHTHHPVVRLGCT